jgi:RNA polymerase sigma-B factor
MPNPELRHDRDARWLRLLRRYHAGDRRAREQLVAEMLPLVEQLARRYSGKAAHEDLVQVGLLGLTKAIDRFDFAHATHLAAYAVPTMLGEMRRHLRDHSWAVRVPRPVQEDALRVTGAVAQLEARIGRSPRPQEIADHLGIPLDAVVEALVARRAYTSASFEERVGGGTGDDLTLGDTLGGEDAELERAEVSALLASLGETLTDRERLLVELRFHGELTQSEIGARLGVSQMQVSRLLRSTLEKLRLEAEGVAA